MIGLVLRLVVWVFAALVVIGAAAFLAVEAMDKAESIQKRAPWIPRILERRDAFVALLVIAVVLLIGDGYELLTKELPEAEALHPVFSTADPGAKNSQIAQDEGIIAALRAEIERQKPSTHSSGRGASLCLHPVDAKVEFLTPDSVMYESKITVGNKNGIPKGSRFAFFFGRNSIMMGTVKDSDGRNVMSSMASASSGIGSVGVGVDIPKGKSLIVTASSWELPVRLVCVDRIDPPTKLPSP